MPRGRRVNSSGEKSKQLLQEKAIELFSKNGFHRTKISDIVKSANLTQPTFYLYFESKDSIYNDLLQQFKDEFIKVIEKLNNIYANISTHEYIMTFLVNIFEYYASKGNLTKISFDHKESSKFIYESLKQILTEKISKIDEIHVDTHIFVESLLSTIERLTLTTLLTNKRTPKELANDIMEIYFGQSRVLVK